MDDPDDQARADARLTGHAWSCFEQKLVIDTGHDLMITEPRFVADALWEIAAR